MEDGTLTIHEGMPTVFSPSGRLRSMYRWIKVGVESTRDYGPKNKETPSQDNEAPTITTTREAPYQQVTAIVPKPVRNVKYVDAETESSVENSVYVFTTISKNLWMLAKYPDWRKPNN